MSLKCLAIIITGVFVYINAYSISDSGFNVCPDVSTGFYAASKTHRTIVVNYEPKNDYFVLLRCGTDQKQRLLSNLSDNSCHIYRKGTKTALCKRERTLSKVTALLANVTEGLFDAAILGGTSTLRKIGLVINGARTAGLEPECLGVSLLKNIATGVNVESSAKAYYEVQVELGPFTGINRVLNRNNDGAINAMIFNYLDSLLIGGNGSRYIAQSGQGISDKEVFLSGPKFLVARRSTSQTHLLVNQDKQQELCVKFPHIITFEQ